MTRGVELGRDRSYSFPMLPDALWSALAETGDYQSWWPSLTDLDADGLIAGAVWRCTIRPPLPFPLRFAIHLDDAFAQQVGLPGRIVHGLCTMAFAGRAVLEAAGIDDPSTVKRIAVRFSAPLFPGESVTTRVWHVGGAFGFESLNEQGSPVLKDGRVELRDRKSVV